MRRNLMCALALLIPATLASAQTLPTTSTAPAATSTAPAAASTAPAATDIDPAELKAIDELRGNLIDAYSKKDMPRLLSYLHKDCVITWQDGRVTVGREEIEKYYNRMMVGPERVVESITADPKVMGRFIRDNISISFGLMQDTFKLKDGTEFKLDSRFSAFLIKEDGHWQVRGFHLSANVFNNEVQNLVVRRTILWVGGFCLFTGVCLGWVLARLLAPKKGAAANMKPVK